MARRNHTILVSTSMLSLGLAIGGHLNVLPLTSPVGAVPSRSVAVSTAADILVLGSEHVADVCQAVMPSTVHIQAVRQERDGRKVEETGAGVIMRSRGADGFFVITNNHVVRGARLADIDLRLPDGRQTHPQRVYRDVETDVAVLQLAETGLRSARWGNSNDVQIGHYVLAVGSPFGLRQSVTMGIVSAKARRDLSLTDDNSVTNQDFLQTDAAINPGNSGGPLIDMDGNVVGINTAIASNSGGSEGIGFSIPSSLARHVFEQLVRWGRVRRGYLGIELDPSFDQATAQRLGLPRAAGARVKLVYRQRPTPASRAGLRPDDVIASFDGVAVDDEDHLINLVGIAEIGRPLQIRIIRGGRRMAVEVTLSDRDEDRSASGTFLTR